MKYLDRLVWVDLETTGLDPRSDVILEAAIIVTDGALNELCAWSSAVYKSETILDFYRKRAHPIVQEMHAGNGLWAQCRTSNALELHQLEQHLRDIVGEYGGAGGPICGSSPHFDKAFLDMELPGFAKLFNHRTFDVSTLKQFAAQITREDLPKEEPAHRAMADIKHSLAYAQRFKLAWGDRSSALADV